MLEKMENMLSDGVFTEEIENEALNIFEANQAGYNEGFVRYMPSEQVRQFESIKLGGFCFLSGDAEMLCQGRKSYL